MVRGEWDGTSVTVEKYTGKYHVNIEDIDNGIEIAEKATRKEAIAEGIIVLELLLKELKSKEK